MSENSWPTETVRAIIVNDEAAARGRSDLQLRTAELLTNIHPSCDNCGAKNSWRYKRGKTVCIECGEPFSE